MRTERVLNSRSLLGLGIIFLSIFVGYSSANCREFQHPTIYRHYKGFFNEKRCSDKTGEYYHNGLDIVGYKGENILGAEVRP
jgi:hypothetical protein